MENASKALIIAGAILISILIIAIGMYIYTSSTGSITDAMSQMDTQAVEAFNANWTNYEGTMTGSQIKAMINKMIGNAQSYQDEEFKVVNLTYDADGGTTTGNLEYQTGELDDFIGQLNAAYTAIQARHQYWVTLDFEGTSLIRRINVAYDRP